MRKSIQPPDCARRALARSFATAAATLCLSAAFAGGTGTDTELAGVLRSVYPWFQYVRSFDPTMKVYVAIDPTLHPAIVGATCNLYVTTHKSPADWATDPTLVDRTSAVEAGTFGGSSIQSNRFVVAGAGEMPAGAGAGLGVAYDVVADCNQNGQLDDGDFIDGRGDQPGLWAVHDTTLPGPYATTTQGLSDGGQVAQIVYYPANVDGLGQLPLVVVSHGWTLDYLGYSHIGTHLASYGYIVMSHRNDVGNGDSAGTETASTSTLTNIDYLLAHQGELAVGGHIDSHRIVLIGHSTGGEGVVRAYTRLRTGYVPQHFGAEDIVLLAPLAPVAFLSRASVNPFDVNFHMFAGAADTDTSNAPWANYVQLLAIYERATGNKQLTYIHGTGHGDFYNAASPTWAEGPNLIGRAATHKIMKGYYVPLLELYVRNNPAALDYFTRMDDVFRPPGIDPGVVLATEYRQRASAVKFVIDDYQNESVLGISSSGGSVAYSVANLAEVRLTDHDQSFAWTGSQAANGMTRARSFDDDQRGVVFEWQPGAPAYYELGIVPAERNWERYTVLSLRAAQGTRHPETVALNGPLEFTVTLRDASGTQSSIRTAAYGSFTRPYQRTGWGPGVGWANEFSTLRLRLDDFLADRSGLDLTDIVSLRLVFGAGFGSPRGRLGLDDLELVDPRCSDPEDGDGDGWGDACDACPADAANDVDHDGLCGDVDNCPALANADQSDEDRAWIVAGQWADGGTASSVGAGYSLAEGAPDNPGQCLDAATNWAPASSDSAAEWLELTYAQPVQARGLRVHEALEGGFVRRIELRDTLGVLHTVWQGSDTTPCGGVLEVTWPPSSAAIAAVRITTQIDGREEIDAVELIGGAYQPDPDGAGTACDPCPQVHEPACLGQFVLAPEADELRWPFALDVNWVRGDLANVAVYATLGFGSLTAASALDLSADSPISGRGFWYLVKPSGSCGSWQSEPGSEPGRDAFLP